MVKSAPGIALARLLSTAEPSMLADIIGPDMIETLRGIDSEWNFDEHLAELVEEYIEPSEVLRKPKLRDSIIRMLPKEKALELASHLDVEDGKSIYDELCIAAAKNSSLEILYSFFGVVVDARAPIDSSPDESDLSPNYPLFHHQRQAAARILNGLQSDGKRVILHMPTGSGKTRTAMHVVATHLQNHEPTVVCWLAHNIELLDQAADEIEKAWRHLGNRDIQIVRFWGQRNPSLHHLKDGVIIAGLSKMTMLYNRSPEELLPVADRASLTIIDEAHQAIAPTYSSLLDLLHGKRPNNSLLGLTATPGRSWSDIDEDMKLSDFFNGQKVTLEVDGYDDPVSYLIKNEYLAKPEFSTLNSESGLILEQKDVKELSAAIDIPEKILNLLGVDVQRNLRIINKVEELTTRHKRIIVFAPSVHNARLIKAILSIRKIKSFVVTAQSRKIDRERAINQFRGEHQEAMVLVNYGVLTTGFDAPKTSAAVIARPTRSLVLFSQMVGRATRGKKARGNATAEIVTVVDPHLPGFGDIAEAFENWEDVWNEPSK